MSSTPLRPTPSPTHAQIRTPLAKVRGLGSAKEGTDHFWKQRVSAVGTFLLVVFVTPSVVKLAGADYATVKKTLQKPAVSISLLLLILSGVYHMRLGMQMIIEDYVPTRASCVTGGFMRTSGCRRPACRPQRASAAKR